MSFLLSLLIFFLPGYAAARSLRVPFSRIEEFIFSFALGIGAFDFGIIFLGKQGIPISKTSIFMLVFLETIVPITLRWGYDFFKNRFSGTRNLQVESDRYFKRESSVFASTTGRERALFAVLLTLTVFIKVIYLSDTAIPTATDLGHHMYWSKMIVETGALPNYAKVVIGERDGTFTLSEPEPIADFIIGEHLPFAGVALVSGNGFFTAFPVNLLLLVDLLSLLAIFALAVRIGEESTKTIGLTRSPFSFGLIALFLAGPLFALASPEAKFVSGGVIGNVFGDLFIPVIFLAFFRALVEKNSRFFAIGIFLSLTLAYIHHLSTLILAFSLFGSFATMAFFNRKTMTSFAKHIAKLLLSPLSLIVLLFAGLFFFGVAMPTYLEVNAVGTAIGTPEKATRTGLSFLQASQSSGQARMAFAIAALSILFFAKVYRKTVMAPLLFGWGAILVIMSMWPNLLFLNIPSNRIANYLSIPIILLAGFTVSMIPNLLIKEKNRILSPIPGKLFLSFLLILFTFTALDGSSDNQKTLPAKPKAEETVQVFAASRYLAPHLDQTDIFLKDHIYLVADSWMKLFFMRDYSYPLSRGYFKRYDDETKQREQCTLLMISSPNLPAGKKCLSDLGVDVIAVNPAYDAAQFEKSTVFSRIYASDTVQLYSRFGR